MLLADVEGSTRLWETQPEAMTAVDAAQAVVVKGGWGPARRTAVRCEQPHYDAEIAADTLAEAAGTN